MAKTLDDLRAERPGDRAAIDEHKAALKREMSPDEEYEFYAQEENQEPQGRPVKRVVEPDSKGL